MGKISDFLTRVHLSKAELEEQSKRKDHERLYEDIRMLPGIQSIQAEAEPESEIGDELTRQRQFPTETFTINQLSVNLKVSGIELHLKPILKENIEHAARLFDFLENLSVITQNLENQCDLIIDEIIQAGEMEERGVKKMKDPELKFSNEARNLANELRDQTFDLVRETAKVNSEIADEYLDEILGISDEIQRALKNPDSFLRFFKELIQESTTGEQSIENLKAQFLVLTNEFNKVDRPVRELEGLLKQFDESLHNLSELEEKKVA